MGKRATKAAANAYCIARYEAAAREPAFSSREQASAALLMDATRLANIELGKIVPHPDEVKRMADIYRMPALCNTYCSCQCSIGQHFVRPVQMDDFDRLSLKMLGALKDIDELRASLISVSEDGLVDNEEYPRFHEILDSLDKISDSAASLRLWAQKNIAADTARPAPAEG